MLKCPICERCGGPFRLRHQAHADGQLLRGWLCPCGHTFTAVAGAEQDGQMSHPYLGFTIDWQGSSQRIELAHMADTETLWDMGPWTIRVAGSHNGPGTRTITVWNSATSSVGEWRLEPTWGQGELARKIQGRQLPPDLDPGLLAQVLMRILA